MGRKNKNKVWDKYKLFFNEGKMGEMNLELQHKIKGVSGNITDHKKKKIALL